jgi:hypothetical protein
MAPACNLENISADVALQVTVRSGILSFRRGHGRNRFAVEHGITVDRHATLGVHT